MNADMLYDAIGEVREEWILDAETVQASPRRHFLQQLTAACLLVLLLALPVSAEMRTGYVSNLLAPLYGGAQTELVDSIGVPINASTTVAGYTLTAEAIIGDRYNAAIVYSLTRSDGGVLPEGLCFGDYVGALYGRGSGGSYIQPKRSEDGTRLEIVEQRTNVGRLFLVDRNVTVDFVDLVIWDPETQQETLWQKGTWSLKFTIRYEDTTIRVPSGNRTVTGPLGQSYQIKQILLSPIGIHIKMRTEDPNQGEDTTKSIMGAGMFPVSVLLTDGTAIEIEDWNCGGVSRAGTAKLNWGTMFDEPIPLDSIQALVICGTAFPVD